MTIQQLKFFCEVCSSGSITAAATNLFITPSGLSMALQRLEKELDCKLLNRTTKGVSLTKEGEFLYSHAREVLTHTQACEDFFHTRISHEDICQVALATNIPDEQIGDLVHKFNSLSEKHKVALTQYPSAMCDQIVENGEAEVGFNTEPFDTGKFEVIPLSAYPLYLLINKSHEYSECESIPTAYLDKSNIIIRESKLPYQSEFFVKCRSEGVEPYIAQEVGNTLTMFSIVRRNPQVFGLVPDSIVSFISMPEIKAIPFEDKGFVRTVNMFRLKNAPYSKTAEDWIEFVKSNMTILD